VSFCVSVCADNNHVRTWTVTRFRGMISTQPGSTPLASFKILSLEETESHGSYCSGNDIGERVRKRRGEGNRERHGLTLSWEKRFRIGVDMSNNIWILSLHSNSDDSRYTLHADMSVCVASLETHTHITGDMNSTATRPSA